MKVLDIFSWFPAEEVCLEEVESVFMNYKNGIEIDEYVVLEDLPENVSEYIVECMEGLKHEGKKVATLIKEDKVVALVGYQDKEIF